jgi:hypothetical protein
MIVDEVHGFLAQGSSDDAMDEAMERAWSNRSRWPSMGEASRIKVMELYHGDPVERLTDELIHLVPGSASIQGVPCPSFS